MNSKSAQRTLFLLVPILLAFAATGCAKKDAPTETAKSAAPQAAKATAATAAPNVTVMFTAVDLGRAVGSDHMISDPDSSFAPGDTVYVAVQANTSDSTSTAQAALVARFVGPGNKVVHEETRNETFSGPGIVNFALHDSKGLAAGRYRAEVSMNGGEPQIREFDVR